MITYCVSLIELCRSVMAIAGEDYAIIAADSRLSTGFSIFTREQEKLFKLSDTTVLGCSGCWCDTLTLARILQARMQVRRGGEYLGDYFSSIDD